MATADTRNSIVITKQLDYRGGTRRFSNRYHFEGAVPSDDAAWTAFADLIVASEKTCYDSDMSIVQADGYDASTATSTNPHGVVVFTKTYTTAGTGAFATFGQRAPGDCAVYVRYDTPARSTKNHPVYLSNYYHGVWNQDPDQDLVAGAQWTAFDDYANDWLAGFLCDGSPRERCGPRGAVATGKFVDTVVRHRDFPV